MELNDIMPYLIAWKYGGYEDPEETQMAHLVDSTIQWHEREHHRKLPTLRAFVSWIAEGNDVRLFSGYEVTPYLSGLGYDNERINMITLRKFLKVFSIVSEQKGLNST